VLSYELAGTLELVRVPAASAFRVMNSKFPHSKLAHSKLKTQEARGKRQEIKGFIVFYTYLLIILVISH